jgi:hypothetical protein
MGWAGGVGFPAGARCFFINNVLGPTQVKKIESLVRTFVNVETVTEGVEIGSYVSW